MPQEYEGVQIFKPNGESINIPGEDIESIGKHEFMGGYMIFMSNGMVIHTDLPFLLRTDMEKLQEMAEEEPGEEAT